MIEQFDSNATVQEIISAIPKDYKVEVLDCELDPWEVDMVVHKCKGGDIVTDYNNREVLRVVVDKRDKCVTIEIIDADL